MIKVFLYNIIYIHGERYIITGGLLISHSINEWGVRLRRYKYYYKRRKIMYTGQKNQAATAPKTIHKFDGSMPIGLMLGGNQYYPPMGPKEYIWALKHFPDMQKEYAAGKDVMELVSRYEVLYGYELPQGEILIKSKRRWKMALASDMELDGISSPQYMYLLTGHYWTPIPHFGNKYYGGEQFAYIDANVYHAPPIDSVLRYIIDKFEKEYFGEENLKFLDWRPNPKFARSSSTRR